MYYRNTSDKSVQMLMEVLEMEAVKKTKLDNEAYYFYM